MTVVGRIMSRYFPRTYTSRRTSSVIFQMKLATQYRFVSLILRIRSFAVFGQPKTGDNRANHKEESDHEGRMGWV